MQNTKGIDPVGGTMTATTDRPGSVTGTQDYQSFSRASVPEACIPAVREEFILWLGTKGIETPDSPKPVGGGSSKASVELLQDGNHELLLCRLIEETKTGRFTTEIYTSSEGWINISVRSSSGQFVSVPRIAKALMRRLDLFDASLQLIDEPKVWDVDKVGDLVKLLEDSDRHGLVFVAGSRKEEQALFDPFVNVLPKWAREVYGLAQTIALTPEATLELGSRVGHYGVGPWNLRTYFPGVDHESPVDSVRHRYLKTDRLGRQHPAKVSKFLGQAARKHAATRAEPLELLHARRAFTRAATRRLIDGIEQSKSVALPAAVTDEAPPSVVKSPVPHTREPDVVSPKTENVDKPPTTSTPQPDPALTDIQSQLDLVRIVLGIQNLNEQSIRDAASKLTSASEALNDEAAELIETQLVQIEQLEDDARQRADVLVDMEFEQAEYQEDIQKHQSEIRWLREKLREADDHASANDLAPVDEDWQRPESCREVLENLDPASAVVFTGSYDHADYVDNRDQLGRAAFNLIHVCWALDRYARLKLAGSFTGTVDDYLRNHQDGRASIGADKHAMSESKVTMDRWGNERMFKVPRNVAPEGSVAMKAHFRLTRAGMGSARMHYFDDVQGSGKVYIGYVGAHLTNTQSN
ncbi:hypothetical protein [Paeniglutamicibacter terrestris]|uniref:Uncharacterized protein n=1 Tax=Paeniglutamicibacter terrestris TaxID=2723403 RepID=A0ABX1G0Z9_9MICC|nr:hypothetical protein [Paeniglutamicibacter terrestris]NKG19888.1 hypothetical protein [Paeniglutamicibacter terrestris]